MKRLAIIGLGLMGGSLGLAARRTAVAQEVWGYARREETRRKALALGAVDRVFDRPGDAVQGADLVVFCVPVLSIGELVTACKPHFLQGCVATDVGSTKAEVVGDVRRRLKGAPMHFIGSHPMAGSEQAGIEAAKDDLYSGATVIVTPWVLEEKKPRPLRLLTAFWRKLGCRVVVLSPGDHDRLIARTSHLPHVVAAALVANLHRDGRGAARSLCGPGFMDTTRIAGGSDLMWHDIIKTNARAVSRELDVFGRHMDSLRRMIDAGDFAAVRRFLAKSRDQRRAMEGSGG